MNTLERHECFEMETLAFLQSHKLLEGLVFGGGTMLRLCHELHRYSADLDFWFLKKTGQQEYFTRLKKAIAKGYEITDAHIKRYSMLVEIRKKEYPKRLKIEIRKLSPPCEMQEAIAYSKFSTAQVLLKTHTLEQTMKNKIAALMDRGEIRDAHDVEFLLRKGIALPPLSKRLTARVTRRLRGFSRQDYAVSLGSLLESEMRRYYVTHGFKLLAEKLRDNERTPAEKREERTFATG